MRIRTAATAACGTLTLLALLAPAAQADTHKGDTTITSFSFSRSTVNVGVSAAQSLTVSATAKDDSGIKGIYGDKLITPDGHVVFPDDASCSRPTSTTMKCSWTYSLDANATDDYADLKNSYAGTWHFDGEVAANDQDFYTIDTSKTVKVKRYAKLTATQASPEPVVKGRGLTVTGTLTRANWNTNVYAGYTSQKVALQFKKSGSSTYSTVKTVTTDGSGKLKTTVTANYAGTWRWKFAGTGTTSAVTATGDSVALK
ncbi:calcium-binding protein [Streptomyces sp. VRA16 Mangrove soil]|uniref:calcium-binding protein n=1 Tax=Streptomyces sp. VRA16 Mangrove soil TaxID=2817434 RepID=UPI001A9D7402|nr:calcium-binding protein [Streptomyces sp. VRA16 Mangrove soil]MBO1333604.1 calcium-binding protein [Streptomyces sp. VRA16 Mangrove soil]